MKIRQLHENIGISIENVNLANIDDITFKEIEQIKKVLKQKLINIYHLRIEYPD